MADLENLQQGTYGIGGEMVDWTYYDTAILAAATLVHRLFTAPLSSAKTLDITNMTQAGQVPQGQRLTVRNIKCMFSSNAAIGTATIQKVYDVFSKTVIELLIPGKDALLQVTLQELMGNASMVAVTPTTAGDNVNINRPRFHGIFPLNQPLVLAALTPFEIRITHVTAVDAAVADCRLKIGLNGILRRKA